VSGFVPYFGYRDAAAALEFLERAFGFKKVTDWRGDDGTVMHGEMKHGEAVLMLGTGDHPEAGEAGHGVYVVVDDVDAHFSRARESGAEVVYPPEETEWGTRRYRCRDPEGYEWSFGSYVPGATR
jgi:uncharacterized glyoxalase superfamily protein PhnB